VDSWRHTVPLQVGSYGASGRFEPLSETWIGRALEHGCATAWLTGTYDPAVDLLYWTTGNPCPDFNGDERLGDNRCSRCRDPRRSSVGPHGRCPARVTRFVTRLPNLSGSYHHENQVWDGSRELLSHSEHNQSASVRLL